MVYYTLFTMAGAYGPRRDKMLRNSKLVRAIKLDLVRLVIGKCYCAMSGSWQQFGAVLLDLGTGKTTIISWAYFVEKFSQGFWFRANFDDVFPVTSTCDVNVTQCDAKFGN